MLNKYVPDPDNPNAKEYPRIAFELDPDTLDKYVDRELVSEIPDVFKGSSRFSLSEGTQAVVGDLEKSYLPPLR